MDALAWNGLRRQARLVRAAAGYELRKAAAFRAGFAVRELLRGIARPAVMIVVWAAIFAQEGVESVGSWSFGELVSYMILVATLQKFIFHNRALDLSTQIFEGYVTKYMVMPVRFVVLATGRFVQYSGVQAVVALIFYLAGLALLPAHWPRPASTTAALQTAALVALGSWCYFELYFILNAAAFWLDVVWSLLVMAHFVTVFIGGTVIPISLFPESVQAAFCWLFPYWTLSAPIEIFLGRLGTAAFVRGLAVLCGSALLLGGLRVLVWSRGVRRYTGSGM